MSYWFFFNSIVFIYASWQVLQHFSYQPTYTHILFGFLGLLFFYSTGLGMLYSQRSERVQIVQRKLGG